jgi:hypothetical protein
MEQSKQSKRTTKMKTGDSQAGSASIQPQKLPGKSYSPVWKIIAIACIAIFAIIIIFGLVRQFHFQDSIKLATDADVNSARETVLNELMKSDDASLYQIKVSDRIRYIRNNGTQKRIIEASASYGSIRHIFLIDADENKIVMHSQIESFGWMAEIDSRSKEGRFGPNQGAPPPPR